MAYNFPRGDRDQPFLLPPDLRDWLPKGHLAWFVLDVTDQLDLAPFYLAHRRVYKRAVANAEGLRWSVDPTDHNPNTPPPATPLVSGPTIRLPGRHAKVNRDGYIGHRRGGPAPATAAP
jgi:hypothetical protein